MGPDTYGCSVQIHNKNGKKNERICLSWNKLPLLVCFIGLHQWLSTGGSGPKSVSFIIHQLKKWTNNPNLFVAGCVYYKLSSLVVFNASSTILLLVILRGLWVPTLNQVRTTGIDDKKQCHVTIQVKDTPCFTYVLNVTHFICSLDQYKALVFPILQEFCPLQILYCRVWLRQYKLMYSFL